MELSPFFFPTLLDQNFGLCINPQDLLFPYYSNLHGTNYYRPWKLMPQTDEKDFGSTISNDKDTFKISLDVQHFKPNEISVKVVDNEVVIEGKHEEREDRHGFITRQFKRRYFLPRDCKADSVTSTLSSDGVLIISTDKNKVNMDKAVTVPIKLSNENIKPEIKMQSDMSSKCNEEKTNESEMKKNTALMLREDHSRLLKPEFLGQNLVNASDLSKQSKEELDSMFRLMSQSNSQTSDQACEELSVEKINVSEKSALSGTTSTEKSEFKSVSSEMMEMQTSYSSSVSSSIKETSEKISELVSGISDQLREAAENI